MVTAVYNLGRYLRETVTSVESQTFRNWELIIVDDGSTEPHTLEVLEDHRRRGYTVIRTENRGPGAARNTAIVAGTGEYIVALDADDRIRPTFLERTVAAMDGAAGAGFAATGVELFGDVRAKIVPPPFDPVALMCVNVVGAHALTRRSCWEEAGGYPERESLADGFEDWSLLLAIVSRGWTWTVVPELLFEYRVRRNSASAVNRRIERRRQTLRQLVELHETLYREHVADVVVAMDTKIRRLETTGPTAFVRRLLRRL